MTIAPLLAALIVAGPASRRTASIASPSPRPAPTVLNPDELFSRRALRRARLLIQMRLFQLREERLECVREALHRRLPAALWPEDPSPWSRAADASAAAAKCVGPP